MAGTVTLVENAPIGGITRIRFTWLSDGSGNADKTTTNSYSGRIVWMASDPDGSTTQPDNLFDITLTDSDGYDILNGNGANLVNTGNVTKTIEDKLGTVYNSQLTLSVANAGSANGGVLSVLIK